MIEHFLHNTAHFHLFVAAWGVVFVLMILFDIERLEK